MTLEDSGWSGPVRLLEDAARVMAQSMSEVVPPEAQMHLLSAQRELLLALAVTIEHNTTRSVKHPRATPRSQRKAKAPSKVTIS